MVVIFDGVMMASGYFDLINSFEAAPGPAAIHCTISSSHRRILQKFLCFIISIFYHLLFIWGLVFLSSGTILYTFIFSCRHQGCAPEHWCSVLLVKLPQASAQPFYTSLPQNDLISSHPGILIVLLVYSHHFHHLEAKRTLGSQMI